MRFDQVLNELVRDKTFQKSRLLYYKPSGYVLMHLGVNSFVNSNFETRDPKLKA